MYTIINSEFISFQGDLTVLRVDIVIDTEADLPEPESNWSTGSMVLIADSRDIRILNNQREWV